MPKRNDISSILVIGSGPIVIGQACEFDYSGVQACKALREEGFRVILINSNPATIMTDPHIADATYIEPITPEFIEAIIAKEKPDAILPTMGGQVALNAAMELYERGILEKYDVELIGSKPASIRMAEDRRLFLEAMRRCGLDMPKGGFAHEFDEGMQVIDSVGFPAIIRPSFTMGGSGGGIAYNMEEYAELLRAGLTASPVGRVLIEESIIGWKEFELEVMRDTMDNCVIVCSIENFDPMGVHTGDSITVAPAQTLTDREYQRMRDAALRIMREIGVETGGSNVQFAMNPDDGRMIVIEMNPRVSRSSALASKATGFPIAKIAAKLAVGFTLDEILNDITQKTPACFEPSIDYVVVKIPRWDFEKFSGVEDSLGVQMKSVGEAMAFGRTFKEALQKAIRSLEKNRYGFGFDRPEYVAPGYADSLDMNYLRSRLSKRHSGSIFDLFDALMTDMDTEEIYRLTKYDAWFIEQCREITVAGKAAIEKAAEIPNADERLERLGADSMRNFKRLGFSDVQLAIILGITENEVFNYRKTNGILPVFKTVDTCAAEFASETPYHYSTYETETEAVRSSRRKVIILGSGPNRIGQGIEFDYCCVQSVFAAKAAGWEAIMINCNPETVSTDYDTTDKLYFEPLTFEDVMNVIDVERPDGVIVTFGGQTPLKLANQLKQAGVPLLGTSPEGIDLAEDRKRFGALLRDLAIPCPPWGTAAEEDEAVETAAQIGYPVLVRPSYVLGGRAMQICYREQSLRKYIRSAISAFPGRPVLIDRFLENAYEFDVDAVSDGERVIIGGVMQQIEEAGIHSGDSSCVLPPYNITNEQFDVITDYTKRLAKALSVVGLLNIQFAMQGGTIYVLEVNPRASRTVPFVSKATGVPLAQTATRLMLGERLADIGMRDFSLSAKRVAIKESVFPFVKFPHVNVFLGPEMRSTGEVMGIDNSFGKALLKAHISSGIVLPQKGNVFISLADTDKTSRAAYIARGYCENGFEIWATSGTANFFNEQGIPAKHVLKHYEGRPSVIDFIKNGEINIVINTPIGENARHDEYIMGQTAMRYKTPFFTTLAAAAASLSAISMMNETVSVKSLQEYFG
ncbi:carbamoyl-phosphate synthase large subunit [Ignavibacteria bacterium]|nr:carbamoyl-phosphate synthase large subunit [Bacteroidota bacterium]MCZ2133258.1 carbamoyl-phosphate synthase large subunit [Bacteroidota bacterium]